MRPVSDCRMVRCPHEPAPSAGLWLASGFRRCLWWTSSARETKGCCCCSTQENREWRPSLVSTTFISTSPGWSTLGHELCTPAGLASIALLTVQTDYELDWCTAMSTSADTHEPRKRSPPGAQQTCPPSALLARHSYSQYFAMNKATARTISDCGCECAWAFI